MTPIPRILLSAFTTAAMVGACSSSHTSPSNRSADASVETGGASSRDASTSGGRNTTGNEPPPIIIVDSGTTPSGNPDGSPYCAAEAHRAEALQLDLLLLMDGSGSMADPIDTGQRKWDVVLDAVRAFVNDPSSAGIGVGLTYFGIPAGYDAGDLVVSCNVPDYVPPAVAIRSIPANASALISSLSAYKPVGGTPTRPALAGAEQYAVEWLTKNPTHRMVIVIATDGIPNDCDSSVDSVAAIASAGAASNPAIPVYVIGVGPSLASLDQVASAGGTGHAYLVDASADAGESLVSALNTIRGRAALPCEYAIPPASSGTIDFSRINVAFTAGGDAGEDLLLKVPDRSACNQADAGWYYDAPASPQHVELCPAACDRARADFAGRIDVLVGCQTKTVVTR